jgi:hypothetical protein
MCVVGSLDQIRVDRHGRGSEGGAIVGCMCGVGLWWFGWGLDLMRVDEVDARTE